MFHLFLLLPNSMTDNRCTCKLIIKTTAAYVYANEQLRLRLYVLVRYSVFFDIHRWTLVNIHLDFVSVNIHQYSLRLRQIKISFRVFFTKKKSVLTCQQKSLENWPRTLTVFKCGKCSWVINFKTIFGAISVMKYAR